MIYSKEVQEMCVVAKGPKHGPAPIPEEGKWVKATEIKDISGHKIEGLPFLRKNTRRCTYAPQDAAVSSKGSPF